LLADRQRPAAPASDRQTHCACSNAMQREDLRGHAASRSAPLPRPHPPVRSSPCRRGGPCLLADRQRPATPASDRQTHSACTNAMQREDLREHATSRSALLLRPHWRVRSSPCRRAGPCLLADRRQPEPPASDRQMRRACTNAMQREDLHGQVASRSAAAAPPALGYYVAGTPRPHASHISAEITIEAISAAS
jgi:hypothetical protein